MWDSFNGVTMTRGFGVVGVENLRFCIENSNTDEYDELFGV